MSVTVHQRPGVYSAYDASSVVSRNSRGKVVGLAAKNTAAEAGVVHMITDYEQAVTAFGADEGENMTAMIRAALKNGASAVAAVATASEGGYEEAFSLLDEVEDVAVLLCGSTDLGVQQKMRDHAVAASAARRERIAVAAGGKDETVDQLIKRAGQLNHERVVLAAPGAVDKTGSGISALLTAAALAGAIAGETDPAIPMGGAPLLGLQGLARRYSDNELDRLILGGVTPAESVGGAVSVVRGVTTRTTMGGAPDATWRELTTIRVVDDVIPTLRNALRAKFRRAKNTERSRGAIRAQVVLELENKMAKEIITGYENVSVTADSEDPTRCVVDFSFTVAHGLNQIWLTAHVKV